MAQPFLGAPYPITQHARGLLHTQSGINQIRSDMLALILTNRGERCLAGDTLIALIDGTNIPIRDLLSRKEFYVYAYDALTDLIVPAIATAYLTRHNAELVEVALDNGEIVHCTPDHFWLLQDGTYVRADKLSEGTALMTLTRNCDTSGYEEIYQPMLGKYRETHLRFVNEARKEGVRAKVVSVRVISLREDCFDLRVEKYHNFALSAGVFVHNCMLPTFGCDLRRFLFEPADAIIELEVRAAIEEQLRLWEPRVVIDNIEIMVDPHKENLDEQDDLSEKKSILFIRINFFDPENIKDVQQLKLEIPLAGG